MTPSVLVPRALPFDALMAILSEAPRLATYNRDALAQIADEFVQRYCAPSPVVPPPSHPLTKDDAGKAWQPPAQPSDDEPAPAVVPPPSGGPMPKEDRRRMEAVYLAGATRLIPAPAAGTAEPGMSERAQLIALMVAVMPEGDAITTTAYVDAILAAGYRRAPLSTGAPSRTLHAAVIGALVDVPHIPQATFDKLSALFAAPSSGARNPEVTDEMVERGAKAEAEHEQNHTIEFERMHKDYQDSFRAAARRIITAALRPEGENNGE